MKHWSCGPGLAKSFRRKIPDTEAGDGQNYARVRIEQLKAEREMMQGQGNARNLAPGYLFTLSKYPRADQNQQYLIVEASYSFEEDVYRSDGAGADSPDRYRLSIASVSSKTDYRSQRVTNKPRTTRPADSRRRRPTRRRNLHRQIRPRQSPIPLGPLRHQRPFPPLPSHAREEGKTPFSASLPVARAQ